MHIKNFTTYDDIRAVLGVDDEELADETLGLGVYRDALGADLEDVNLGVPGKYQELLAMAEEDLTAEEERFFKAARVFAVYAVARHLTVSLSVFSPMRIDDGKASMQRTGDPHRETVKAINREFDRWRNRLLDAYIALGQSAANAVPRPYLSVVSPSDDPITG